VPSSLRFIKSRSIPNREVHHIQWNDVSDRTWNYFVSATQVTPGIWSAKGCAGGSGPGAPLPDPPSASSVSGTFGEDGLIVGGCHISDPGQVVGSIRLAQGEVVLDEDVVDHQTALFIARYSSEGLLIMELIDKAGNVLKRQAA